MCLFWCFVFFKQKTAYEMRISDWSSDVCSSDLHVCTRLPLEECAAGEAAPVQHHATGLVLDGGFAEVAEQAAITGDGIEHIGERCARLRDVAEHAERRRLDIRGQMQAHQRIGVAPRERRPPAFQKIGRASGGERGRQYVYI